MACRLSAVHAAPLPPIKLPIAMLIPAQEVYSAGATCTDIDRVGAGNETFSCCSADIRYDNTNSNKTIALLDVNGTLAAAACCSVSVRRG
jgi:hypothetical protein